MVRLLCHGPILVREAVAGPQLDPGPVAVSFLSTPAFCRAMVRSSLAEEGEKAWLIPKMRADMITRWAEVQYGQRVGDIAAGSRHGHRMATLTSSPVPGPLRRVSPRRG